MRQYVRERDKVCVRESECERERESRERESEIEDRKDGTHLGIKICSRTNETSELYSNTQEHQRNAPTAGIAKTIECTNPTKHTPRS